MPEFSIMADLQSVNVSILPRSDNTYDLGSPSYRWRNLELAGYGNLGSLKIGGTEVISGDRRLHNVLSDYWHTFGFLWGGNEPAFPAINNSLAYADKKFTVTVNPPFTRGSISNVFDRRAITDARWDTTVTFPATIEIDFGTTIHYWTTIGVFFNWDTNAAARYVKIEVFDTRTSTWVTLLEVTNNTSQNVVWRGIRSYVGKIRFTFDQPGSSGIFIGMIYGHTSHMYGGHFLDLEGLNKMMGHIQPFYDNAYDLGSSSYRWRNLELAGYGNLGSLRIGGTEVVDSSRVLKNVSADASIIASGVLDINRIPEFARYSALVFDDSRVSVYGTTETSVKYFRFSKTSLTSWSKLKIVASLWVSGGTGSLNVYIDAETSPRLTLSTSSTSETSLTGEIDVSDLGSGIHTLTVKLVNSSSYYTYNELLEVYAI